MPSSIRKRLGIAFIGLTFCPMLLVIIPLAFQGYQFHKRQALDFQRELAQRVGTQVETYIKGLDRDLALLVQVQGLREMDPEGQRLLLSQLQSYQDAFSEFSLLDETGQETLRLSAMAVLSEDDLKSRAGKDEFEIPMKKGTTYYGPVRFDETTNGEPLMTLAEPMVDMRSGEVDGVLAAEIRLKPIWDIVAAVRLAENESLYIVDAGWRVVAHQDPSIVRSGTRVELPEEDGFHQAQFLSSKYPMASIARDQFRLGDQVFTVVVEKSMVFAMSNYIKSSLLVAIFVVLPVLLIGHYIAKRMAARIVGPIRDLSEAAMAIENGDLSRRAAVMTDDEIGQMAASFNSMTAQLQESLESLKQEIADRQQAEEAQRASENRYRVLLQSLPQAIFHKDSESVFLSCNESFAQSVGCRQPEDVVGKTDFDFFPKDLAEKYRADDKRVMDRGETEEIEERFLKEGQERYVFVVKTPLRDDAGIVVGLLGIFWDITERKNAEIALRSSEHRYRTLLENLPQSIFHKNANSVFLSSNESFARNLGVTPEGIVGKTDYDFYPKELADKYREDDQRIMAGRKSVEIEERHVQNDQTMWVHVVKTPLMNDRGEVTGLLGIFWDITERKNAEIALTESEKRYRLLAENVSDVIWTMDKKRNFTYMSPSVTTLNGFTVEEAMTRRVEELLTPESIESMAKTFSDDAALASAPANDPTRTRILELEQYRKDGSTFWTEVTVSFLRNEAGKVTGYLGVSRDITQRKRLQAQIQHTQKLESLGVLAGGIAHDFNNLLMGILGNASLALMTLPEEESKLRRNVQQIETAGLRAADLAKQMLAYSGKGKFVIEPINMSLLVEEMAHLLEASISKKAVMKFDFAKNMPLIEGDPTQIRQVIMNLITNASEAIGDQNGAIGITTGVIEADINYFVDTYVDEDIEPGFYAFLEVSDTGCGMTPENRRRIFDPFFTTKFMGRGLGLAAVLGIIRGHRGAVKIYSEVGKGTTFKVLFPVSKRSIPALEKTKPSEDHWKGTGTILIIDDEETVRTVAKMILEEFGFTVLTAVDGADGVDVFREHASEVQAILLDMTMPRLSGDQAYVELRRIRADIPVVLSSGYNEQEATNRFAGKGLAGFLQKPYQPNALLKTLQKVLSA